MLRSMWHMRLGIVVPDEPTPPELRGVPFERDEIPMGLPLLCRAAVVAGGTSYLVKRNKKDDSDYNK